MVFFRKQAYRAEPAAVEPHSSIGKSKMIAALEKLKSTVDVDDKRAPSLAALKISQKSGMIRWFASHPPLTERIKRLQHGEIH